MPVPLPLNPVSLGFECHTDINLKPGFPLIFDGPPPIEGETAGLLQTYDVEAGSETNPVFNLMAPQTAGEITLDIEPGTSGTGALDLTQYHSVSDVIEAINQELEVLGERDGMHIPLGGVEQIDGAVPLQADTPLTEAIEAINARLAQEISSPKGAQSGAALMMGDLTTSGGSGAIQLDPGASVTETIEELNQSIADLQAEVTAGAGAPHDGFQLPMGEVETEGSGAWSTGPVPIQDSSKVSSVIDQLNAVLGKLVPAQPPAFPNGVALQLVNATGSAPLLCSGVDDKAASGLSAGAPVTRITDAGVSSNAFDLQGPGSSGSIEVLLNGAIVAAHALTGSSDVGDTAGLVISAENDYPANQPGFWKAVSLYLSEVACPIGISAVKINHTAAGVTNTVRFVCDDFTAPPQLSGLAVSEQSPGTLNYSSGVPHYGVGGQLQITGALSELAGQTYYGGADPLAAQVSDGGSTLQPYGYGQLGFSVPFASGFAGGAFSALILAVNAANAHGSGQTTLTGKNVNGSTSASAGPTILFKAGQAQGVIDELSVAVSGLGSAPSANNAARVSLGSGDTPAGAASTWSATSALPVYEAAVVGGVLSNNDTDYSSGYLPVGPNYSVGRAGEQYVTFAFNRSAVSGFKIAITGAYAQCHVKLPGVTDQASISPSSPNGWMNAFASYTGAGVPGAANDPSAGCALGQPMSGGSGVYQITFGTQSSTNATSNQILVRFKLSPGQSITSLSFTN